MGKSFVYILASRRNGTLYVDSTTNLVKRVWEHKNNKVPALAWGIFQERLNIIEKFASPN